LVGGDTKRSRLAPVQTVFYKSPISDGRLGN
jgi:hypothetical protein